MIIFFRKIVVLCIVSSGCSGSGSDMIAGKQKKGPDVPGQDGKPSGQTEQNSADATPIDEIDARFTAKPETAGAPVAEEEIRIAGFVDESIFEDLGGVPLKPTFDLTMAVTQMVDLRGSDTPIRNQGNRGTCTAFAMVAGIEHLAKAQGVTADLSEEDLWSRYGAPEKWMYMFGEAKKAHLVSESQWPYNGVRASAASGLARLTGHKPLQSFAEVKSTLDSKKPVYFVSEVNDYFMRTKNGAIWPGGSQISGQHAAHAYLVSGYAYSSTAPGGGFLILKNSWDTGWGDRGYGYLPFAYCEKYACMAFSLDGVEIAKVTQGPVWVRSKAEEFYGKWKPVGKNAGMVNRIEITAIRFDWLPDVNKNESEVVSDWYEFRSIGEAGEFKVSRWNAAGNRVASTYELKLIDSDTLEMKYWGTYYYRRIK